MYVCLCVCVFGDIADTAVSCKCDSATLLYRVVIMVLYRGQSMVVVSAIQYQVQGIVVRTRRTYPFVSLAFFRKNYKTQPIGRASFTPVSLLFCMFARLFVGFVNWRARCESWRAPCRGWVRSRT